MAGLAEKIGKTVVLVVLSGDIIYGVVKEIVDGYWIVNGVFMKTYGYTHSYKDLIASDFECYHVDAGYLIDRAVIIEVNPAHVISIIDL